MKRLDYKEMDEKFKFNNFLFILIELALCL